MTVQVTVRDDSVTQGMKTYAAEKGEKLRRIFNGIQTCEVILGSDGPVKRAEFILTISGAAPLTSHAEHDQLNAAIDLAVDRSEKQLRRFKDKLRDHHREETLPPENPPSRDPDEDLESYGEIVDKRDFPE